MLHEIIKGMDNAAELINENFLASGIVESGSGENGSFIRFGNGTQICWKTGGSLQTTNNAMGSVFISSGFYWEFPMAYTESPSIITSVQVSSGYVWGGSAGTITNDNASFIRLIGATSTSSGRLNLFAIGSWK